MRFVCVLAVVVGVGVLRAGSHEQVGERNACIPPIKCCRVCTEGKACGNTCIAADKTCHKGRGCACSASEVCAEDP